MGQKKYIKRLYDYQKERFPFAVLIFTTLSVVLSSAAVVSEGKLDLPNLFWPIVIGTITCLLFMFSIRVFDDHKDHDFDSKYYEKRPIQRGDIALSELNKLNIILLLFQGVINILFSIKIFFFWLMALGYSLIARNEFFMKEKIRKKFIVFNILNLMQIFFLQIYLYYLIMPGFSWSDPLLLVHFIFVLINAGVLEIARKMKSKNDESKGLDTYSGRYGALKASLIYLVVCSISYALFLVMFFNLSGSMNVFYIGTTILVLTIATIANYYLKRNNLSSKLLEGFAILFYLSMHLLLFWSVI